MLNLSHRTKTKSRTKYCNFIVIYLYSKPEDWSPNLDGLSFNLIDANTTAKLERSFEDEKDFQALKSLKAPGPYGFSVTLSNLMDYSEGQRYGVISKRPWERYVWKKLKSNIHCSDLNNNNKIKLL